MDVLLVTPELVHYHGSSTLAESAGALGKALRGLGHKVDIVSPLWASIDPGARHLARRLVRLEVASGGGTKTFALFEGKTTAGVDVSFLSEPSLFPADATADEEGTSGAARWGAFARAVAALLRRRLDQGGSLPEVIHTFGWQTGVLPCVLGADPALAAVPTVFTVHDLSRKGSFERSLLGELGLSAKHFGIDGVEFFGRISTLKAGLQFSTRVIAPSPSLASRFVIEAGGDGLEGVLRARGRAFVGIADGVDASIWSPATDPHLDVRYDAIELGAHGVAKLRNKAAVQTALGLPVRDDVALAVAVTRGRDDERAFLASLPRIVKNDVQLVVLSGGALHEDVADLARRFPDRLAAMGETPVPFVHRVLGAADLCVLPALEDAFGVLALQAQRYGALPVARAEGLVADTVVDADAQLVSGTGFTFVEGSADALFGAVVRAASAYRERARFRAMQERAMLRDHSWDRTARLVERAYRGLRTAQPEAAPPA